MLPAFPEGERDGIGSGRDRAMDRDVKPVWRDDYKIHSYEVDSQGRVTVPMLCQLMQDSAWNHAQHLGVGYEHLIEKQLLWVLARQLVAISFLPQWGERIHVHTWPTGRDRLFCYRDFRLLNDQNQFFGSATTAWFVIDVMNRKPQRTDSYFDVWVEHDEHVFSRKPAKIEPLHARDRFKSFSVGYKDLDLNEHVNNVRYVEWILESFPCEFQKHYRMQEMEITYLSEARYDDTITACYERKNARSFLHSVRRDSDDTELCRAKTIWTADRNNAKNTARRSIHGHEKKNTSCR